MFTTINTYNREMKLNVVINCNGTKTFRIVAQESGKKNSKYADRIINVDGTREIYLSFPVTPKSLLIGCVNVKDINDNDFELKIEESQLQKYNIWVDEDTNEFYQLAITFSQVCGFHLPPKNGVLYHSESEKFRIKYMPVIVDYISGKALSTPSRIGHNTGIIEVSAAKFVNYTIPMRLMILAHEFSHKYKNPQIGLQIGNEVGADINALYTYLGLGFSKIDAICVFANVFLKAQTDSNIVRMRKIQNYIYRFENQEFAQKI